MAHIGKEVTLRCVGCLRRITSQQQVFFDSCARLDKIVEGMNHRFNLVAPNRSYGECGFTLKHFIGGLLHGRRQ